MLRVLLQPLRSPDRNLLRDDVTHSQVAVTLEPVTIVLCMEYVVGMASAECLGMTNATFSKTGTAVNKRFDAYIALAADNVSKLRNSDVFRVLSAAKSTKELTALVAYIKGNNPALSSTLDEDAKDVKEEKGW